MRASYARSVEEIKAHHDEGDQAAIDMFMERFTAATFSQRSVMLKDLKRQFREAQGPYFFDKKDRKRLKKAHQQALVKRDLIVRIIADWLITVPATALLTAVLFFTLRGMLLP